MENFEMNVDFFQTTMLNLIETEEELREALIEYIASAKKGTLGFQETNDILNGLSSYFSKDRGGYKGSGLSKKDVTRFTNSLKKLYKKKKARESLNEEQLALLRVNINLILTSLKYVGIDKDGGWMSVADTKKFLKEHS